MSILLLSIILFISLLLTHNTLSSIIVLGGLIIGRLVSFNSSRKDNFLFRLFVCNFLARLIVCLLLYTVSLSTTKPGAFLGADDWNYMSNGGGIANMWERGIHYKDYWLIYTNYYNAGKWRDPIGPYDIWNSMLFYLGGYNPLSVLFVNCLAGSLVIALIYLISLQIFDKRVAIISSLLASFWPSIFLWSTQNLKEPLTAFLVALSMFGAVRLKNNFRIVYLLMIVISISFLGKLRPIVDYLISAVIILSFLVAPNKGRVLQKILVSIVILTLICCYIAFSNKTVLSLELIKQKSLGNITSIQKIDYIRKSLAQEASLPIFQRDLSTYRDLIIFLPLAILVAWLSPFPWQLGSTMQILSVSEGLVWYILFVPTLGGVFYSVRNKWRQSSPILILLLIFGTLLGLLEGNIGSLFRHRSVYFSLCFIFTAAGLVFRKQKTGDEKKHKDSLYNWASQLAT